LLAALSDIHSSHHLKISTFDTLSAAKTNDTFDYERVVTLLLILDALDSH
jgi:hypothetical protein